MKRVFVLLTMLINISFYCAAQHYTEVIYLKNGSIIKGTIIEQIPNVSLKIKTGDGSLIICKMDEVDKITKEESYARDYRKDYHSRRAARNTLKGYKGFINVGYLGDINDYDGNKIEISTSHGYQFNNYFFVGGGMAVDFYTDSDWVTVPFFANFRANFINKKVTPFADIKTGFSAGDVGGFYASIGMGARFSLKGKKALNLILEYHAQEVGRYDSYNNNYYYYNDSWSMLQVGIKAGFEF